MRPELLLQRYGLKFERSGEGWRLCCPFHGERNASLFVKADFSWYCFGCGRGGGLAEFVEQIEAIKGNSFAGLNDVQKLLKCAKIIKAVCPSEELQLQQQRHEKKKLGRLGKLWRRPGLTMAALKRSIGRRLVRCVCRIGSRRRRKSIY